MKLSFPAALVLTAALAPNAAADLTLYTQDFEALDAVAPTALGADGWKVFANVFDSGGGYLYGYGVFDAPNGGAGFSALATGAGGPAQGLQYVNAYSDYGNTDHGVGNYIEANVFQEQTVGAADVGATWTFSFDHLKNPAVVNGDGDTTTLAFVKIIKVSDGSFATLAFETFDTTNSSTTVWDSASIDLLIDPTYAGEVLQFGFASTATNYNDSGRFYDNVSFDAPGASGPGLADYAQDFEALDIANPTALGADGWKIFANVFDPAGGYLYGYGVFDAPNGGAGFSAIGTGAGGPPQGTQYLNAYSDYGNVDHANGNVINALLFQEQPIGTADAGTTWRFAFDHRKNPDVVNGSGATTTQAFVKVLKVSDGSFATLALVEFDSTNVSDQTWASMALDLDIDPTWVGELVQFGFSSFATNYDDSGRFYDNLSWGEVTNPGLGTVVCLGNPNSTGGSALLTATGSTVAADNDVTLNVDGLPTNEFGMFVRSNGGILLYNPGMSEGHLCIASFEMGRFNASMLDSGAKGSVSLTLDLTSLPSPSGAIAALAGDTHAFQYWTRDGMGSSNFSSAVAITFE